LRIFKFGGKMGREYPSRPIVSVGAVVLRNNQVLLIKRGVDPSKGKWSIPGGVVELGEKLRECVSREVKEECNIEVEVGGVIDIIDHIIRDERGKVRFHYVLIDFLARYLSGELKHSSDALDSKWVDFEEIPNYDLTETALRVIRKALKEYALENK